MRPLITMLLAIVALSASCFTHAEYEISRKRIYYYSTDRGTAMEVTNSGDTEMTYSAYTRPWNQDTKDTGLDMVAYPPNFTLAPGESQTIRLLLRTQDTDVAPLFYRLFISEVPDRKLKATEIQLSMSLPVYYLNQDAVPEGVVGSREIDGKDGLAIKNVSDTILHLTHFSTGGEGFRKIDQIILPGRTYGFIVEGLRPPYRFKVAHGEDILVM